MDCSLWVGDLVVVGLWGTLAARGWMFRYLFGVGIFCGDGDGVWVLEMGTGIG